MEAEGAVSDQELIRYAREVGLDVEQFASDVRDQAALSGIKEGKLMCVGSGVNGTPTLCVNGLRYDGPVTEEALKAAIQAALTGGTG